MAVILSIKTREANRINDSETARKYSKWTITSSLLAIAFGVISAIFCLIMVRYKTSCYSVSEPLSSVVKRNQVKNVHNTEITENIIDSKLY